MTQFTEDRNEDLKLINGDKIKRLWLNCQF